MSKAAKALYMSNSGDYLSPASNISGYRDRLFSLYYILYSLFISLSGLEAFISGNFLSAILGIITLYFLSKLLYNNFNVSFIWSCFTLLNIPLFIVTFSYSNEASLSFLFLIMSLQFLDYEFKYKYYLSGIIFSLACFSRPDTSLLIPFWLTWQYIKSDNSSLYNISKSLISLSTFGIIYSFYILGGIPLNAPTGFKWGGSLKLVGAMLSYPFGIPIAILSLYGIYESFFRYKSFKSYSLILTTLPTLFYISNLSSPKYLIHLIIPVSLFASLSLQRMSTRWRYASVLFILLFWFVSVSPFGIKLGGNGAKWYLPTADGAIPTGSYAYFYSKSDSQAHRSKYLHELNNAQKILEYVEENKNTVTMLGGFNGHALKYVSVVNGYDGKIPNLNRTLHIPNDTSTTIMARRSYLWGLRMSDDLASQFVKWLKNGKINSISCSDCPFPALIKVGDNIDINMDSSLGERILFVNKYTNGFSSIKSSKYIESYRSLSWTKKSNVEKSSCDTKFTGSEYYAYDCAIDSGIITRMTMPFRYTDFRSPKFVKEGYNELFYKSVRP